MNAIQAIQPNSEPHSIEAEQQILGALLLGAPSSAVQEAGGGSLFYDPVHAEIYRTCRRLEVADRLVSPVTVKATLSDELTEAMQPLGGVAYLATLAGAAITPRFIGDYASVLAEEKHKRTLLEIMRAAQGELSKGEKSTSDIAAQMEAAFQALSGAESRVKPVSMMGAVTDALGEIYAAHRGDEVRAVHSGIQAVDELVAGFEPGHMWLLGGRPSMGKTAVGLSLGLNAARAGHPVVIASLEMTPQAMARRAISEGTSRQRAATSYSDLRRGRFSQDQSEAIQAAAREISQLPITFLPREFQDTALLQAGVKQTLRRVESDKLPLVIIDYAQLLKSNARTRYEQITDVSLAIKGLAMSLSCPVIALSQLSRALEQRDDKRPMMSDLRESGQLEQDADGVMFCYRDEYYLEREEPNISDVENYADWEAALTASRNRLEIIIAKQRDGPIGTAHVRFNPALNLVWE